MKAMVPYRVTFAWADDLDESIDNIREKVIPIMMADSMDEAAEVVEQWGQRIGCPVRVSLVSRVKDSHDNL